MRDITGRDDVIIAKALAYAITLIDQLPAWQAAHADRHDMVALLRSQLSPATLIMLAKEITAATGRPCDLAVIDPNGRRRLTLRLVVPNE